MPAAVSDALVRELGDLIGSANVLTGERAARYALHGQVPTVALKPGSLEELSGAMRLLHEAGAAVVPLGSGTHAETLLPPRSLDAVLLTERLDALVEYNADDLTACAQAGARFSNLQIKFSANRQWLALDPPLGGGATLGGVFAGARIGPRRVSTGAPRDRVLGMTAVLADGTVVHTGGRVVKNVSGYDLHRLLTGSYGTLAVLAQIHVRLSARPEAHRTLLWTVATVPEAGALLSALEAARVEPAALELLDSPSARGAEARGAEIPWRAKGAEGSWTVALLFEGALDQVDALVGSASTLVPERKPVVLEGGLSESFWQGVSELSCAGGSALTADGRARLFIRASVLPTDVAGLVQRWHTGRFDPSLGLQVHAHAASGHVNLKLTGAHIPQLAEAWELAAEDLRGLEGTGHLVDAPAVLRSELPLWFGASGPLPLMKALKDSLDPGGTLSPGRLPFDA